MAEVLIGGLAKRSKEVTWIDLTRTGMTDAGAEHLLAALPRWPRHPRREKINYVDVKVITSTWASHASASLVVSRSAVLSPLRTGGPVGGEAG